MLLQMAVLHARRPALLHSSFLKASKASTTANGKNHKSAAKGSGVC
jgi:hypothetical protein